jgi:hypothetical protein
MTGLPEHNFPAFHAMANKVRELGYEVLNPADFDNALVDGLTWHQCMKRDIGLVAESDALVVLSGWEKSKGACIEVQLARWLNLPVFTCETDKLVVLPEHPFLLGLSGYAGAGKDELGKATGFQRVAFADPMREAMVTLNPKIQCRRRLADTVQELGWDAAKRAYPEIRELLQRFGTEVGRELFGENVWVDLAVNNLTPGDKYVVTDVRFPNEAQKIKEMGGFVYRINRPGVEPPNAHYSERALADWKFDGFVENDGTLDDLAVTAKNLVEEVSRKWDEANTIPLS